MFRSGHAESGKPEFQETAILGAVVSYIYCMYPWVRYGPFMHILYHYLGKL